MLGGRKISALLPKSSKKLSKSGVIIPTKTRYCNEGKSKIICGRWSIQKPKIKSSNLI